jgi:hypothetical protein
MMMRTNIIHITSDIRIATFFFGIVGDVVYHISELLNKGPTKLPCVVIFDVLAIKENLKYCSNSFRTVQPRSAPSPRRSRTSEHAPSPDQKDTERRRRRRQQRRRTRRRCRAAQRSAPSRTPLRPQRLAAVPGPLPGAPGVHRCSAAPTHPSTVPPNQSSGPRCGLRSRAPPERAPPPPPPVSVPAAHYGAWRLRAR